MTFGRDKLNQLRISIPADATAFEFTGTAIKFSRIERGRFKFVAMRALPDYLTNAVRRAGIMVNLTYNLGVKP